MKKYAAVAQEESMGCGIACVASRLGITYQEAIKKSGLSERSYTRGYYCRDLVKILNEFGEKYAFKKVGLRDKELVRANGSIVFAKRGKKYLVGHWLLKTPYGWMDPWINWPSIHPSIAGYHQKFPGEAQWIVYEIKIKT